MINYNQIDLDKVKEEVSKYAAITDSRIFIMNEIVPFNPLEIQRNLNETKEILNLLKKDIFISFSGIENINHIFNQAKKEMILTLKDVSDVLNFHNHCKRIKNTLDSIDDELDVKDYSDSIYVNDLMAKQINDVVDNYGNIKDDASDNLKNILKKIETNEQSLNNKAHEFLNRHNSSLQEASIFLRNGRVVFLLKNADKNKYKGYSYGSSSSGLATYVEPESFIDLNNNKIAFEEEKEEEIKRILMNLTYLISDNSDYYINNFNSLLKLDVVYAKAMYGFKECGIVSSIGDYLYLKDVCHPLINKDTVISNTYTLSSPYKGIVISGTNTGGKTVGLKTIGLSVLETYLGIPVIASESIIPLYNNVFVDIDDNQSISNSLSTFSAHISNINYILNNANHNSLILIDELISGTDPKEAQAISLSILNKILELGSSFVITTHYDDIKNFAYKNPNILLSSVGFDTEKLQPTYKYIENSVGSSNALDIAERYFDDHTLIEYARSIVKNSSSKEEELMNKLAKEIENNVKLKEESQNKIDEYNDLINSYKSKIDSFEKDKNDLKIKYQKELNEYIDEIKQMAQDKLDSIVDKKDIRIIKEIEDLSFDTEEDKQDTIFEVGDNVKVGSNDMIGVIDEINNDKVVVNINGMSIKTTLDNLTKMPKTKKKAIQTITNDKPSIKRELNLVGKHIDEALMDLEPFLDAALLNNLSEVKVIHGIGTGQLKNAIRDRLKKLKFVKSYDNGDFYDGAGAVTIVRLK